MGEFFANYGMELLRETGATLFMTLFGTLFGYVLGLPLGIWCYATDEGSLAPNKSVHAVLGWIINITRSIPFIILMLALIPFTRMVVGKAIGSTAALVPLVIGAAPFVARMVESSLSEIDHSLVDCAKSMGATNFQIVSKVLLPETLPSLIRGMSIATITIIGYTAMAGAIGGGGLGDVAIRYGYHRGEFDVMYVTILILIVLVQVIQVIFNIIVRKIDKNKS